jgi:hypothetical protein
LKKVLIISYYWPPSGGAGVQRWLKFVKYLPKFGYEPHVYTPSNPEAPAQDESLQKDVPKEAIIVKQPILEPYSFYKKFTGKKVMLMLVFYLRIKILVRNSPRNYQFG